MISIIAAYNNKKVIGKDGKIPWKCPADLKRFKDITMGAPVIMGRKTWDSLPVKPLPGRPNIVVSRKNSGFKGAEYAPSVASAILGATEYYCVDEIFIIGGEETYRQALAKADKLYLSHIDDDSEGDSFFPDFEVDDWDVVVIDHHPDHTFRILERRTQ